MLVLFFDGLMKRGMVHSEGIYLSEELSREVTVDEIKERSVARRLPV
jgi:hypothetical protein